MPPEHAKTFGGGLQETTLNPVVLAALILASILMFVLPRKYAVVPFLVVTFLVPLEQSLVVAGAHFYVSRIIVLAGLGRLIAGIGSSKDGVLAGGWNSIDKAFFWCTLFQVVSVLLLFHDGSALINQVGVLIDVLGAYLVLRFLIRDQADMYRALKCLALISIVLSVCMVVEQVKDVNVFYYIGGGRLTPEDRDGKLRSQAVFLHELLAGAFGSTLLPLAVLLWKSGKAKVIGAIGIVGSSLMTLTSNSSTPLLAYVAGVLAICLWPIRRSMRTVRRTLVLSLLGLALVMKAPVWFIIAHIDLTGGSSGYHRALLIDQFINHFSDWWLIGVKDTGSWGWDMWDAQNQFVNVGETGGLAAFIFFIVMITRCFSRIGTARRAAAGDKKLEWCLWFLGAALFSHIVGFFGVNYFDQMKVSWYTLLAIISVATTPVPKSETDTEELAQTEKEEFEFHPALASF